MDTARLFCGLLLVATVHAGCGDAVTSRKCGGTAMAMSGTTLVSNEKCRALCQESGLTGCCYNYKHTWSKCRMFVGGAMTTHKDYNSNDKAWECVGCEVGEFGSPTSSVCTASNCAVANETNPLTGFCDQGSGTGGCAAGYFAASNQVLCTGCPTGTFSDQTGLLSEDQCQACPVGTFTDVSGADQYQASNCAVAGEADPSTGFCDQGSGTGGCAAGHIVAKNGLCTIPPPCEELKGGRGCISGGSWDRLSDSISSPAKCRKLCLDNGVSGCCRFSDFYKRCSIKTVTSLEYTMSSYSAGMCYFCEAGEFRDTTTLACQASNCAVTNETSPLTGFCDQGSGTGGCGAGYFAANNQVLCRACPAGTFSDQTGLSSADQCHDEMNGGTGATGGEATGATGGEATGATGGEATGGTGATGGEANNGASAAPSLFAKSSLFVIVLLALSFCLLQ